MLDKILEMHLILLAFTLTICYLALIRFKMHLKSNSSSTLGKRLKTNIALMIFTINKNIYIYICFGKDKIDNKVKFSRTKLPKAESNGSMEKRIAKWIERKMKCKVIVKMGR